jgi:hypothetical protein
MFDCNYNSVGSVKERIVQRQHIFKGSSVLYDNTTRPVICEDWHFTRMWKRLACPHHVILYVCTLYHIPLSYILAFCLVLFLWYNSRFYTCHILYEPIGRSGMSVLCLEDVTLLVRKRQLAAAPCYGLSLVNMRNDACDRSILPFNRSRTTTHSEDRSVNFAFQHVTNDNS